MRSSLSDDWRRATDWCCRPSPAASRCRAGAHGFVAQHASPTLIWLVADAGDADHFVLDDGGFADARLAPAAEPAVRHAQIAQAQKRKESSDANSFQTDRLSRNRTGSRAHADVVKLSQAVALMARSVSDGQIEIAFNAMDLKICSRPHSHFAAIYVIRETQCQIAASVPDQSNLHAVAVDRDRHFLRRAFRVADRHNHAREILLRRSALRARGAADARARDASSRCSTRCIRRWPSSSSRCRSTLSAMCRWAGAIRRAVRRARDRRDVSCAASRCSRPGRRARRRACSPSSTRWCSCNRGSRCWIFSR